MVSNALESNGVMFAFELVVLWSCGKYWKLRECVKADRNKNSEYLHHSIVSHEVRICPKKTKLDSYVCSACFYEDRSSCLIRASPMGHSLESFKAETHDTSSSFPQRNWYLFRTDDLKCEWIPVLAQQSISPRWRWIPNAQRSLGKRDMPYAKCQLVSTSPGLESYPRLHQMAFLFCTLSSFAICSSWASRCFSLSACMPLTPPYHAFEPAFNSKKFYQIV